MKVEFKVHKYVEFALDPLRYVDGCVGNVWCLTSDRGVFTRALNSLINDIGGDKWALFYCKPNMSLANALTLLHIDNDVRRFFSHALNNGSIDLFIAHKQQPLSKYNFNNMVWQEEGAGQCWCSSTPFKYNENGTHIGRKWNWLRKNVTRGWHTNSETKWFR